MNGLIWRPSDLTREVLREFDIPETRENLSKMMYVLRNRFTQDIYLYAAKEHIEKYKNITIFFDGIRKIHFIQELQKIYKCTLLYIDTPTHIRYERIRER
jgi:dephospho-CoA kinase